MKTQTEQIISEGGKDELMKDEKIFTDVEIRFLIKVIDKYQLTLESLKPEYVTDSTKWLINMCENLRRKLSNL